MSITKLNDMLWKDTWKFESGIHVLLWGEAPRSPDLSPMDFQFWGGGIPNKSQVY